MNIHRFRPSHRRSGICLKNGPWGFTAMVEKGHGGDEENLHFFTEALGHRFLHIEERDIFKQAVPKGVMKNTLILFAFIRG
jgi:hypothetical protein